MRCRAMLPEQRKDKTMATREVCSATSSAEAIKENVGMNKKPSSFVETGAIVAGTGACAVGATAAAIGVTTTVTTAGVSAAAVTGTGAAVGGIIGGTAGAVLGAGAGIATGGTAIAATVPMAAAGATTGAAVCGSIATTVASWLGIPIATTTTIVTTPVWAIPVAAVGGVAAVGFGGWKLYKLFCKQQKGGSK